MKTFNFIKREAINWLFILLPFIYISLVYDRMPQFALFNSNYQQKIYQSLFFITIISILFYIVFLVKQDIVRKTSFHDNLGGFHKIKTLTLAFQSLLSLTLISHTIGMHFNYIKIIFILGMGFMMTVGNLYPTIRFNYLIGIKNPWTQSNEDIWKKTHRFAGKLFFWGGLTGALYVILFNMNHYPYTSLIFIGYIFGLRFLLDIYSYRLYRKLKSQNVVNIRKGYLSGFMMLSSLIVIIGAIFKIQHWPGSNLLMLTGLLFCSFFLVAYYKSDNSN